MPPFDTAKIFLQSALGSLYEAQIPMVNIGSHSCRNTHVGFVIYP